MERTEGVTLAPDHLSEAATPDQDPSRDSAAAGTSASGDWTDVTTDGPDDLASSATTVRW